MDRLGLGWHRFCPHSATGLLDDLRQVTSCSLCSSGPIYEMGLMRSTSALKYLESCWQRLLYLSQCIYHSPCELLWGGTHANAGLRLMHLSVWTVISFLSIIKGALQHCICLMEPLSNICCSSIMDIILNFSYSLQFLLKQVIFVNWFAQQCQLYHAVLHIQLQATWCIHLRHD